ncbi:MAG: hypothetical protein ACPHN2_04830 [Sinimarinibacterium flocculans]|uniref:hypothetical protein n=1 Tax=Sinimarinibacterium flocculans TaxID=985250 RepID=UPI003C4F87D9
MTRSVNARTLGSAAAMAGGILMAEQLLPGLAVGAVLLALAGLGLVALVGAAAGFAARH